MSLKCESSIDDKSALVHVMARHRTGTKPLHELMMTQLKLNDGDVRHPAWVSQHNETVTKWTGSYKHYLTSIS